MSMWDEPHLFQAADDPLQPRPSSARRRRPVLCVVSGATPGMLATIAYAGELATRRHTARGSGQCLVLCGDYTCSAYVQVVETLSWIAMPGAVEEPSTDLQLAIASRFGTDAANYTIVHSFEETGRAIVDAATRWHCEVVVLPALPDNASAFATWRHAKLVRRLRRGTQAIVVSAPPGNRSRVAS
jgi:hypothetical protein